MKRVHSEIMTMSAVAPADGRSRLEEFNERCSSDVTVDHEVTVVGGGPAGLFLGGLLARLGTSVVVIDNETSHHDTSRATGIHSQVLEVLDELGLLERFLEVARPIDRMDFYRDSERITEFDTSAIDARFPYGLSIVQEETERILREFAEEQGAKIEFGHATVIRDRKNHVSYRCLGKDGRWTERKSWWLVGCDGVYSTVRRETGFSYLGPVKSTVCFAADLRLTGSVADPKALTVVVDDDGSILYFPLPDKDTYRVFTSAKSRRRKALVEPMARIKRMVDVHEELWANTFEVRYRHTDAYRKGRILLAGDAAHCHSPAGGHGLNMGLMDGHNLAWKLAAVCGSRAHESLLDSYDAERRPIVDQVITRSKLQTDLGFRKGGKQFRSAVIKFTSRFQPLRNEILKFGMELSMNYGGSPIVRSDKRRWTDVLLRPWSLLQRGPRPRAGERFPSFEDRVLWKRIKSLAANPNHVFLLFGGDASHEDSLQLFDKLSRLCDKRRTRADCRLVLKSAPSLPHSSASIVLDPESVIHNAFGAQAEAVVALRPDGFIGYRASSLCKDDVIDYLDIDLAAVREEIKVPRLFGRSRQRKRASASG